MTVAGVGLAGYGLGCQVMAGAAGSCGQGDAVRRWLPSVKLDQLRRVVHPKDVDA